MSLKGKTVYVFAEDLYEEMELWVPVYRLREAGAEVFIIGTGSAREYKGKKGSYPVTVDGAAADFSGSHCDALIIPGGYAPDKLRRYKDIIRITREAFDNGVPVASICHGPWVLCSADVVRGKRVTASPAIRVDLENAGAIFLDEEVVVDGNLITSRHPDDLPAFNKAIIAAMRH
ncbi:MAG: type 1 glutamine amidotransferase domain-containing protein [Candidatus Lernaella stagnicola]|nr:type 1 glutamine amidotransferase domain-containing protein [Candidatus Lernaella stagnicola]